MPTGKTTLFNAPRKVFFLLLLVTSSTLSIATSHGSWWSITNTFILISAYLMLLQLDRQKLDRKQTKLPKSTLSAENDELDTASHSRALILSNDSTDRLLILSWFTGWGVDYHHSTNCVQAYAELLNGIDINKPYDIVVTDQGAMDITPIQFITTLRTEPKLKTLFLINLGSKAGTASDTPLIKAGYNRILQTPLDKRVVFSTIKTNQTTSASTAQIPRLADQFTEKSTLPSQDILIAESNQTDLFRLKHILQQLGHKIYAVTDGEAALEALDTHHFDMAILSATLKGIDGITVVKLYRHTRMNQTWIPLAVLLEPSDSDSAHICSEADIRLQLKRPATTEEMSSVIYKAVVIDRNQVETSDSYLENRCFKLYPEPHSVDIDRLSELKKLSSDHTFLSQLIDKFEGETEEILINLKQAQANRNLSDFRMLGHRLKDSSGNLGALGLYRQGVLISQLGSQDLQDTALELIHNLAVCRSSTILFLESYSAPSETSAIDKD